MIKGHVCIDLHNHNSGFTERIEKDNMVTNAIQQCLVNLGMRSDGYTPERMSVSQNEVFREGYNSPLFPLCKVGLGGLMLFDGKLTEDKNNVQFPTDVHLVGFGGSGINTASPTKGSLNYTDTKYSDDGRSSTRVWDFATNQANGKIASLSLTHEIVGSRGPSPHMIGGREFSEKQIPIKYDKANHILYVLAYEGTTYHNDSGKRSWNFGLYTQYNHLETITINQDYRSIINSRLNKVASWTVDSINNNSWLNNERRVMFIIKDKVYFMYTNDYSTSGNYNIIILSASIDDIVRSKNNTAWTCSEFYPLNGLGDLHNVLVTNDAIYVEAYPGRKHYRITYDMIKVNTSIPQLSSIPTDDLWTKYSTWCPSVINNCHFEKKDNNYYIVYDDGTTVNIGNSSNTPNLTIDSTSTTITYLDKESTLGIIIQPYNAESYNIKSYIGAIDNYLGTICNLSEPITKTESTSMKVTYTLSAV